MLRFCRTHGITGEDQRLLGFLVREHLTMSMTAQKRDLADPEVIAEFAQRVQTPRRLTALYLLTVADIRGTSARVWNAWKGKLLEDLYRATLAYLSGHTTRPATQMDVRRQAAAGLLRERGIPDDAYQAFWNTLDIGYFLRHDPQDLAWHTEMLHAHADERRTSVHTRASGVGDGIEFLIFTMDKPALFARICRFFDQQRLSILEARVHTTRHGMALDSFEVMTTDQRRLPPEQLTRLEAELAQVQEALTARQDQVTRTVLTAPVHGIVKNIRMNTRGGVIQPGQDIMEIIPLEDQLLVEAKIRPHEVAFLRPGLPATVKISAYDYAIYGGLHGKVELISPDTLRDDEQRSAGNDRYYRVLVRTTTSTLHAGGKDLPIIPGMTASVEIRTGEKTVMDYILKPILKMREAFRER